MKGNKFVQDVAVDDFSNTFSKIGDQPVERRDGQPVSGITAARTFKFQ